MMRYYLDNFLPDFLADRRGARRARADQRSESSRASNAWGLSNWAEGPVPGGARPLRRFRAVLRTAWCPVTWDCANRTAIFTITLLKQFGIDASGALFVDDKAMNIVGANEAGIRGVRFKDARALRTPCSIDAGVAYSRWYMKNNDIRRLDRRLCLRSLCGVFDAHGRMH